MNNKQQNEARQDNASKPELQRSLGFVTVVSLVVGAVIGSGIFMKPATMAAQLGSPALLLGVWVAAGLITLMGALTNAEIAAMFSETGGQYLYFQSMYGRFFAFLYGWSVFAVTFTGGLASITFVCAEYTQYFVLLPRLNPETEQSFTIVLPFIGVITPLANLGVKMLTIGLILLLTGANYLSVRLGGLVQTLLTIVKVVLFGGLIVGLLLSTQGSWLHLRESLPRSEPGWYGLFAACMTASAGAFWAFDGWNNITYISGEIKNPQRTIPRALLLGLSLVIIIYALINVAYLYVLPFEKLSKSPLVASEAALVAFGGIGGAVVALAVILSTLGTTNGNILAGARLYYAMARDGMFWRSAAYVHPIFHTPSKALVFQAVWTSLLVMSGTFDTLTDMLIFVSWVFYALGAFGVFVLRRKFPDEKLPTPRPYKVWGYPWVPIIFVLFAAAFVVQTFVHDIQHYQRGETPLINSVFGLFLTATGIPLYYYFYKRKRSV